MLPDFDPAADAREDARDPVAYLVSQGVSRGVALLLQDSFDDVAGKSATREDAEKKLRAVIDRFLNERFGDAEGRERLVPPGYERT